MSQAPAHLTPSTHLPGSPNTTQLRAGLRAEQQQYPRTNTLVKQKELADAGLCLEHWTEPEGTLGFFVSKSLFLEHLAMLSAAAPWKALHS